MAIVKRTQGRALPARYLRYQFRVGHAEQRANAPAALRLGPANGSLWDKSPAIADQIGRRGGYAPGTLNLWRPEEDPPIHFRRQGLRFLRGRSLLAEVARYFAPSCATNRANKSASSVSRKGFCKLTLKPNWVGSAMTGSSE